MERRDDDDDEDSEKQKRHKDSERQSRRFDRELEEGFGLRPGEALKRAKLEHAVDLIEAGVDPQSEKVTNLIHAASIQTFESPDYNMWANVAEADRPDWFLFAWFLIVNENAVVEGGGLFDHIEWILQKQFKSVDEWLGPEGDNVRWWQYPKPEAFKARWHAFRAEHVGMTIAEIETEITKIADYQRDNPVPKGKAKRGRR